MGCKGSKHALYLHGGCGAAAPEPRRGSRRQRHSVVALRSAALGTLSLDRAAAAVAAATAGLSFLDAAAAGGGGRGDGGEGTMTVMNMNEKKAGDGAAEKMLGPSRSFGVWRPATPPLVPQRRRVLVAPRTPSKTPVREAPEEINLWELMRGLDDDDDDEVESEDDVSKEEGSRERIAGSAPGSPVFDPELLDAFRKAIDELPPGGDSLLPDSVKSGGSGDAQVARREIPTFRGIVRARVDAFQERINAKAKRLRATTPAPAPAPPESVGRVVVYLTSLRGVRRTYEDCCSTTAVLRAYGARVDERDLSMHAGFKDELRAALGGRVTPLPQVFADGRHLGGAEEVRRLHEAGELAAALEACRCDGAGAAKGDAQDVACCARCGGVRFVPCGACSGSCKVFVEDEDGAGAGAFRRCPECNENGLVRCPVC